jgi:hypothetical protein
LVLIVFYLKIQNAFYRANLEFVKLNIMQNLVTKVQVTLI